MAMRWAITKGNDLNDVLAAIARNRVVYALAEDGDVLTFRPGKKFELVARNSLGVGESEMFRSSIGISDGQLLIRSDRRLYCVGKR